MGGLTSTSQGRHLLLLFAAHFAGLLATQVIRTIWSHLDVYREQAQVRASCFQNIFLIEKGKEVPPEEKPSHPKLSLIK